VKSARLFYVGFFVAALGMLVTQCGGDDPCDPDPCPAVDGIAGSCMEFGINDFICACDHGVEWDGRLNRCGECIPNCEGRECGNNGCGGSCGTCDPGETCENGQCEACTPDCTGLECGDDGCGGSCGTCPQGEDCIDGICVGCTPDCTGLECGDDGCGGSCGTCPQGESCVDGQCVAEGGPEFPGGSYIARVPSITQAPRNCTMSQALLLLATPIIRSVTLPLDLPSGEIILLSQEAGSPYPLFLELPVFGMVEVALTLDETYQKILMDGPDEYTADTSAIGIAGVECLITGSADGEFTDINNEPLTGFLTIQVRDVQPAPGGVCNPIYLRAPTGDCTLTVNLNAGSPIQ